MRSFFVALFGLLLISAQGQNSSYTKVYKGSSEESAVDMAQLANGDHYLLSNTSTFGSGGSDILLTRTNGLGEVSWTYAYGTGDNEYATSLLVTNDGGVLITGYTDGVASGKENGMVIKVSSSGGLSWNKFFYNDSFSRVYDATQTNSGGIYVVGVMDMDSLGRNAFVSSLSSTGNVLWSRTYGGEGDNEAFSIGQDGAGRFVIAGYTDNDSVTIGGTGDRDVQVMRLAPNGTVLWSKNYGTNQIDMGLRVLVRNYTYYIGGYSSGGTVPGQNMMLVKLDTNGSVGLATVYGTVGDDEMHDMNLLANGDLNLIGRIQGVTSGGDIGQLTVASNGAVVSSTVLGGDSVDVNGTARILISRESGSAIFASGKSFLGLAQNDLYLIKTESDQSTLCGSKLDIMQEGLVSLSTNNFVASATLSTGASTTYTATSVSLADTTLCCKLEARVAMDTIVMCTGDLVRLGTSAISGYTYAWTANNSNYTSSAANPQVSPSTTTTYKLKVTESSGECTADSAYIVVVVNQRLQGIDFARDSFFCQNDNVVISAYPGLNSYSWAGDGYILSGRTVTIQQPDTLVLTVIDNNSCIYTDTVVVAEIPLPEFSLGRDTTICENTPIRLVGPSGMSSYVWNGQASSDSVLVTNVQKIHTLRVVNAYGCAYFDQIVIQTKPFATFSLGPDTTFCEGASFTLMGPGALSGYIWNDTPSTLQNLTVYAAGTYHLKAFNSFQCPWSDTVVLSTLASPSFSLGADTGFCPGADVVLQGPLAATYLWDDGGTDDTSRISSAGTHWLRVTDGNNCAYTDSIQVEAFAAAQPSLGADTTICFGDTLILDPGSFTTYDWGGGISAPTLKVTDPGTYSVSVVDVHGCTGSDQIEVDTMRCTNSVALLQGVELKFFPNPTSGELRVSSEMPLNGSTLRVLDMTGREVIRMEVPGRDALVDLSELAKGSYQIVLIRDLERASARVLVQ